MKYDSKYIPSIIKELTLISESYSKKEITAERAMDFVNNLISPTVLSDEIIIKTVAFFWDLEVDKIINFDGSNSRTEQNVIGRHMLRYFLVKRYSPIKNRGHISFVARKLGLTHGAVSNSLKQHENLIATSDKYKEIFYIISEILKL